MKKSILKITVFMFTLAFCFTALSCSSSYGSSWGKNSPCTRIAGESINSISTFNDSPINAGQENYMKAKAGDYFFISYRAAEGNCKVEISDGKEILYSGNDMVGTLGKEKQFTVKVTKSGTYKVLVDTKNFTGFVTVEKKS